MIYHKQKQNCKNLILQNTREKILKERKKTMKLNWKFQTNKKLKPNNFLKI